MVTHTWVWRLMAPATCGYFSFFNFYAGIATMATAAWATWRWR